VLDRDSEDGYQRSILRCTRLLFVLSYCRAPIGLNESTTVSSEHEGLASQQRNQHDQVLAWRELLRIIGQQFIAEANLATRKRGQDHGPHGLGSIALRKHHRLKKDCACRPKPPVLALPSVARSPRWGFECVRALACGIAAYRAILSIEAVSLNVRSELEKLYGLTRAAARTFARAFVAGAEGTFLIVAGFCRSWGAFRPDKGFEEGFSDGWRS
jgi:hypothetical protein